MTFCDKRPRNGLPFCAQFFEIFRILLYIFSIPVGSMFGHIYMTVACISTRNTVSFLPIGFKVFVFVPILPTALCIGFNDPAPSHTELYKMLPSKFCRTIVQHTVLQQRYLTPVLRNIQHIVVHLDLNYFTSSRFYVQSLCDLTFVSHKINIY